MTVYLITTIHNRETRWEYIRNHLNGIGVVFTVVIAPDYRLFQYAGLTHQQAKHQSLSMAYFQIAQAALFDGHTKYLVFEDDVMLNDNFEQDFLSAINSLPEDWDFFYGTKTEHNRECGKTAKVNDLVCKVKKDWWETPVTLWGERIIPYFVQYISNKLDQNLWVGNIDHELLKICEEGKLNFYASEKNLANGMSSSQEDNVFKIGCISA